MKNINIGETVIANYNSGTYIGKAIEERRKFYLVEILAVHKHPTQGDLHNPGKVEGVGFYERKALSYTEKANVSKRQVKPYDGEIPDYKESLNKAFNALKKELESEDTDYNYAALKRLNDLFKHYYSKL